MHPNPAYRNGTRALHEMVIEQVGFGMIFAETPDGPRVAHTPFVSTKDGAVQFHLSRANALTKHLAGTTALAVINGPDAYVSARWHADRNSVPTWNFVALELEGRVRQMEPEGTLAMLETLSLRHEAHTSGGTPWSMRELTPDREKRLLAGIAGFEMEVREWRDTVKLSQDDGAEDRSTMIAGLEENGESMMANLMQNPPVPDPARDLEKRRKSI